MRHDERAVIEREVRGMLESSPAFHALSAGERRGILDSTTAVASQLVEQQLHAPARRARDPYALGQEGATGATGFPPGFPGEPSIPGSDPLAPAPAPYTEKWRPDERFQAEGVAAGVTQAGRMVREVNFPAFVSSLVKGTFNAVVDASIQQMKAYGELVNSVAMSITQFRDQNVDPGEGQKHLASKYPNIFSMAEGTLKVNEDFDDESMPDFQAELGLDAPVEELDEDAVSKLVVAARTEIARGRQQLLATTILMGINRIIVTDGRINAKVTFDFTAHDEMTRSGTLQEWDKSQKIVQDREIGLGEAYVKGHYEQPVPLLVSATTAQSTAEINAKAKLVGEVSLNFRSETFPLERMMSSDQLLRLNQAQGGGRGVPASAPQQRTPAPAPQQQQQPPAGAAPAAPPAT